MVGIFAVTAIIICYELSISKTIEEYRSYNREMEKGYALSYSDTTKDNLSIRNGIINNLFNQFILDTLEPDKNLLAVSSMFCKENGLQLKEYRPFQDNKNQNMEVFTRVISIEGPFLKCLNLLYQLERSHKVGKISSVSFKSYEDRQEKKIKLNCTIYVQNLISYDHDKN